MNFRLFLLPFSFIYSLVADLRNGLFRAGILKQHRFKLPIILVGNLSVGGTGKTPHVEYLVRLLRKEYKLATLSRGYGRKSKGFVIAGKGSNSDLLGDEPMQYHSKFDDITVAVCENRVKAVSRLTESSPKPEVIIMDDGFQHRSIDPGLKILLTPLNKLFTRDYVLPAGDLREARSGYKRADCIIVTRSDENISGDAKLKVIRELNPLPHQKVFFSSLVYDRPVSFFNHDTIDLEVLRDKPVLLFTGIAQPEALINFIRSSTTQIICETFPDHHNYSGRDIKRLIEKFDKFAGPEAMIITTEKDYQRLKNASAFGELRNLPCYFIPVTVKIDKEVEFNTMIKNYVEKSKGNS